MTQNWDSGISYTELKKTIKLKLEQNKKKPDRYVKILTYAIQLRNGGRISEALEALKCFAEGKKADVRVRKKRLYRTRWDQDTHTIKKVLDKDGNIIPVPIENRTFVFPEFVKKPIFDKNTLPIIENMELGNLKVSARSLIGVNTHSIRYARITELVKKNKTDPIIVAKIIHHSDPKFILKYFQQKEADELNERVK